MRGLHHLPQAPRLRLPLHELLGAKGRVEELETTEMSLAQSLSEAEQRSRSKERKLCEEINRLRDEINLGGSRELANCENLGDESLKMECDAVKEKLRDMTCHLEEKYKQFQDTESSLRSEVCYGRLLTNCFCNNFLFTALQSQEQHLDNKPAAHGL